MGAKVTIGTDLIEHNGSPVSAQKNVYILYNKPKNIISTTDDELGRKTVLDAIQKATSERVYPVGRLDRNTTGLLLLTNDGALTEKLTHPSHQVKKRYQVMCDRAIEEEDFLKLKSGVDLEDGLAKVDKIEYVLGRNANEVIVEIHSGKNRIVRRMFEAVGARVMALDRSMLAFLNKKGLSRGKWRMLNEKEVAFLKML